MKPEQPTHDYGEPWKVDSARGVRHESGGVICYPLGSKEEEQKMACRIVACVNACAGMTDPVAEIAALRATADKLAEALNNCATGLKDKNGKDIYEGDIVRYIIGNRVYVEQVAWENYGWVFLSFDGGSSSPIVSLPSLEVIGNITENPELKTP